MSTKKYLMLMLAFFITVSVTGPGLQQVNAAMQYVAVAVQNGSFEDVNEDGTIPGWSLKNSAAYDDAAYAEISSNMANHGQNSLYIFDNDATNNINRAISAESDLIAIKEGQDYTVAIDVFRGDNPPNRSSNRPLVQVAYYKADQSPITRTAAMSKYAETTQKEWKPFELTTKAPEDAAYIQIILISSGSINHVANVYYDNVTLKTLEETVDPDPIDPTDPANPPIDGITDLGAPLQSPQTLDAAFGQENGVNVVYTTVTGSASAQEWATFNVIDIDHERLLGSYPLEGTSNSWQHVRTPDGRVFIGASNKMFVYSPASKKVTDLGIPLAGTESIWGLASDEAGNVYGGIYSKTSGSRVFKVDHATLKITDLLDSPVDSAENYVRSIAYYNDHIYAGTGSINGRVWKINLTTKEKQRLELPGSPSDPIYNGKFNEMGFVYGITAVDNQLFAFFNGPFTMHVYDMDAEQWREKVFTNLRGTLAVTQAHKGKVYTSKKDGWMWEIDVDTLEERPIIPFDGSIRSSAWMDVANQPEFPDGAMVTISYDGRVVLRDLETKQAKIIRDLVDGIGINLQSMEMGPDGNIYISGYMGSEAAQYNTATGEFKKFPLGQAEGMGYVGDTMYFGLYPGADIVGWDTTTAFPVKEPGRAVKIGAEQDRPFVLREAEGKLIIGTIAGYGFYDGALTVYDPAASKIEGSSVFEVFPGIVKDQSITGLAYKNGIIYGATTIHGGLGSDPKAARAKLFSWNMNQKKKLAEWDLTLDGLSGGLPMISGLTVGPDGLIWGAANGFIFAFDSETRAIVKSKNIHPSVNNYGQWRPVQVRWGNDGLIYSNLGSILTVINPDTLESRVLAEGVINIFALDRNNELYFAKASRVKRIAAEKPAELVLSAAAEAVIPDRLQLKVNGELFGWEVDLSDKVEYHISDPSIARVEDGKLIPLVAGSTTISASFRGKQSNEIIIEVQKPQAVKLPVSIVNASFEEAMNGDGAILGWTLRNSQSYTSEVYGEIDNGQASHGANSLHIYNSAAEAESLAAAADSEWIPILSGVTYYLEADVYRGDNPDGGTTNSPSVQLTYFKADRTPINRSADMTLTLADKPSPHSWGRVELIHQAPAEAAYLQISLGSGGDDLAVNAYFDHVSLSAAVTPGENIELQLLNYPDAIYKEGEDISFTAAASAGATIVVEEEGVRAAELTAQGMETPISITIPAPEAGVHQYQVYALIEGHAVSLNKQLPAIEVYGLTDLDIEPPMLELGVGSKASLQVIAHYGPIAADVTAEASYKSSKESVAAISGSEITAISEGSAVITVSYNGIEKEAAVSVSLYKLERIELELPAAIYLGDTAHAKVTGYYRHISDQSIRQIDLKENVQLLAVPSTNVDINGLAIKGERAGDTVITSQFADLQTTASLKVLDPHEPVRAYLKVPNDSFEDRLEDGSIAGWSLKDVDPAGVNNSISSSEEQAKSGKRSVKIIDASTTLSPVIQSSLIEILPDHPYTAGVSIFLGNPPAKPEGGQFSSSRTSFQVRYYDADKNELTPANLAAHNYHLDAALGRWHDVQLTTDAPSDAKYIRLNLFTSPLWVSTAYYDDVFVSMMVQPDQLLPKVELQEEPKKTYISGSDIVLRIKAAKDVRVAVSEKGTVVAEAIGAGDSIVELIIPKPNEGFHSYTIQAHYLSAAISEAVQLPVIQVVYPSVPVFPTHPPIDPNPSVDSSYIVEVGNELIVQELGMKVKLQEEQFEKIKAERLNMQVGRQLLYEQEKFPAGYVSLEWQMQLGLSVNSRNNREWTKVGEWPGRMLVEFNSVSVAASTHEYAKIGLYRLDELSGVWKYVPSKYDPASQRLTAAIHEAGQYALLQSDVSFADTAQHWARLGIEALAGKGIVNGRAADRFDPQTAINRAEFTALLMRAMQVPISDADIHFTDISNDAWYAEAVKSAVQHGITAGTSAVSFSPERNISRQEMAVMLGRTLRQLGVVLPLSELEVEQILDGYSDKDQLLEWALADTALLIKLGILQGRSAGQLAPAGNTTRAESAVMLQRLLDKAWETDPTAQLKK